MNSHYPGRLAANRGFTLVEAIVVMAILSIVMLALMSFIIPTQQSMKMQSNVSDVQSNLNLAVNVLTRDLLMAGFLVDPKFDPPTTDANCPNYWKGDSTGDDMAPGPIFWQGDDITEDNNDLTIRTRSIGNAFAVVESVDSANDYITPTHADMFDSFCNGDNEKVTKARIFVPVGMTELPSCSDYSCEMVPPQARTVTCDGASETFKLDLLSGVPASEITLADITKGSVIIGSTGGLPMQTIRYRVNNNVLERIVNGNTQLLARGVTALNFTYGKSVTGTINRVDVNLTGVISAVKAGGGAQLSEKTREIRTTVNLRNVF